MEYTRKDSPILPKLALLTGTFGTEVQNGVGRFLWGLHTYSRERSYPLDIFSTGDHIPRYPGVREVHALSFPIPQFEAVDFYYPLEGRRRQLRRALKALDPDVVHISTPDPIGLTGLVAARDLGRPVAAVYHTDFPAFGRNLAREALRRRLEEQPLNALLTLGGQTARNAYDGVFKHLNVVERLVLRRALRRNRQPLKELLDRGADWLADAVQTAAREVMHQFYSQCQIVIARSEVYRKELVENIGLLPDQVKTLHAGVDADVFSPIKTVADEGLRQRLVIPPEARVVLYVGRVTDEKNVYFLADAWRRFTETIRSPGSTVFVVVGSGQLDELKAKAGRDVRILGPRYGEELSAIYRLADVFWTAATTETLGQVILEAQASGVPTIVSDRGAAQENVATGVNGLVLPVDASERWAAALRELLNDSPRRRGMSEAARKSAETKTISASYEHFWQLHAELREGESARPKFPRVGRLPIRVPGDLPTLPRSEPAVRTTHLSDFHAGHGAPMKHKERAIRIIAERARDRKAGIYLHGDFTDTRPKLKKMHEELEMVRRVFAEVGVSPQAYIEGNHDYEFARSGRLAKMVGCPVEPSLVVVLEGGLVVTHGHVSEIRELPAILRECRTVPEITAALAVEKLSDRLKQTAFEYDLTGVVQDWLERSGLAGLEDWWRHILPNRRRIADALLDAAKHRGVDTGPVNALGHMIGSQNREQVLAELCAALGGWGLVYGHTHDPHLSVIEVPGPDGKARRILIGNSGSMRRKRIPPTWIETQGRTMELYAYDKKADCEVLVDRLSMEEPAITASGTGAEPARSRFRPTPSAPNRGEPTPRSPLPH